MAKSKTASFYIRRTVNCTTTAAQTVTIDTSAYVDPADRQGLMIESVDFVFFDSATNLPLNPGFDVQSAVQLLTGAYSDLQGYSEEDLIASSGIYFDAGAGSYNTTNLYPDVLGSPDGRIMVDDQMSLVGASSVAVNNASCAIIIKARVVTLTNKDYMALALQTVAN